MYDISKRLFSAATIAEDLLKIKFVEFVMISDVMILVFCRCLVGFERLDKL